MSDSRVPLQMRTQEEELMDVNIYLLRKMLHRAVLKQFHRRHWVDGLCSANTDQKAEDKLKFHRPPVFKGST